MLSVITGTHQLNPSSGAGVSQQELSLCVLTVFLCKAAEGAWHRPNQTGSTHLFTKRYNTPQLAARRKPPAAAAENGINMFRLLSCLSSSWQPAGYITQRRIPARTGRRHAQMCGIQRETHAFCLQIWQSRCSRAAQRRHCRTHLGPAAVCILSAVGPIICLPDRQASNVRTGPLPCLAHCVLRWLSVSVCPGFDHVRLWCESDMNTHQRTTHTDSAHTLAPHRHMYEA